MKNDPIYSTHMHGATSIRSQLPSSKAHTQIKQKNKLDPMTFHMSPDTLTAARQTWGTTEEPQTCEKRPY